MRRGQPSRISYALTTILDLLLLGGLCFLLRGVSLLRGAVLIWQACMLSGAKYLLIKPIKHPLAFSLHILHLLLPFTDPLTQILINFSLICHTFAHLLLKFPQLNAYLPRYQCESLSNLRVYTRFQICRDLYKARCHSTFQPPHHSIHTPFHCLDDHFVCLGGEVG